MKALVSAILALSSVAGFAQQRGAYGIPAVTAQPAAQPAQNVATANVTAQAAANPQSFASATPLFLTVSGVNVSDPSGQQLGPLQYLLLSPSGTADLGVVQIGGRLIPVPWQLITPAAMATSTGLGRGALMLNVDRQTLLQAPALSLSQLSQLTLDATRQGIFAFYGLAAPGFGTVTAQGAVGTQTNVISGSALNSNAQAFGTAGTTNFPNMTRTNQAQNTTSGLLSPTGQTNGIFDGFNQPPPATGTQPTAPQNQQTTTPPQNQTTPPAGNTSGQNRPGRNTQPRPVPHQPPFSSAPTPSGSR